MKAEGKSGKQIKKKLPELAFNATVAAVSTFAPSASPRAKTSKKHFSSGKQETKIHRVLTKAKSVASKLGGKIKNTINKRTHGAFKKAWLGNKLSAKVNVFLKQGKWLLMRFKNMSARSNRKR